MFGYISTASTSTIVQTVSRCIVARCCAIGTASTVCARSLREHPPGQPLDPGGRRPLADPDRQYAGAEREDVAALDVLELMVVHLVGAGEPRVERVDQIGQLGLAHPGRHRQRGDRDRVPDPHARVAGEQQVRQRVDQEVLVREQRRDQPAGADLVVPYAGHQRLGQLRRVEVGRATPAGSRAGCRRAGGPRSRRRPPRRVPPDRSSASVSSSPRYSTSTPRSRSAWAKASCSSCARPTHGMPSNSSLSLFRGVSRRSSLPGAVQHHRPQRPDLAVDAVRPVDFPEPRSSACPFVRSSQPRYGSRALCAPELPLAICLIVRQYPSTANVRLSDGAGTATAGSVTQVRVDGVGQVA